MAFPLRRNMDMQDHYIRNKYTFIDKDTPFLFIRNISGIDIKNKTLL